MAPKITVKKDYILVEPKEVDYWEIWEGVKKLRSLPEFFEKNNIWVFHESQIKLKYHQLYDLKDFIKEMYPENKTKNKTAVVVETDAQSAMAIAFSRIAEKLPLEIKIFTDFQAAEDWIINE